MIHIRVDDEIENNKRRFHCGLGPTLPEGDKWIGQHEVGLHHIVDCQKCSEIKRQLGTPISKLSGQPGHCGYEKFVAIAQSWGFD